jgi:uncharacterized alkaline shock family protein YloU
MSNVVPGNLIVSEEVIADVAAHAARDVYGVVAMSSPDPERTPKFLRRPNSGVTVSVGEEGTKVDLYVIIEHGVNINTVSANLAEALSFALDGFAQGPLDVEVHVQGIQVR